MVWPMKKTESKHLSYDQLARLLLLYKTEASEWEEAISSSLHRPCLAPGTRKKTMEPEIKNQPRRILDTDRPHWQCRWCRRYITAPHSWVIYGTGNWQSLRVYHKACDEARIAGKNQPS